MIHSGEFLSNRRLWLSNIAIPIFILIFLQMMEVELNYSNSGNLAKTFTHWQLDDSN